jgi:uncharacterized SAM-binding protein YcdF (DUF218 family)
MFLLKKITGLILTPLTVCILLLVSGLFLLLFTRRQKTGKFTVTLGVVFLLLISYDALPDRALGTFEHEYPPLNNEINSVSDVKWIVVLGGGHITDPNLPAASRLSGESLSRVVEGVIIHRSLSQSRMLLSGGHIFDPVPESKSMAELAIILGIDKDDIHEEPAGLDTEDQAILIKKIVGKDKFILVTSAFHMPRSMALFQKQGMHPIPAPSGYRVKSRKEVNPFMFFPDSGGIEKMEFAVHEYLGMLWAKLRGRI